MSLAGWSSASIVLLAILTAWVQPSTGGLVHAAVLVTAGALAVTAGGRSAGSLVHPMVLLPLACAIWGAVQAVTGLTEYTFATWNSATAWLARASLFSVAFVSFQVPERRARLLDLATWFGGAFSLLTMLQWHSAGGTVFWLVNTEYTNEVSGTFLNRDQYAVLMELLLPIALAKCLDWKGNLTVSGMCAGLMFASVVSSGSRAGTAIVCLEALAFLAIACLSSRRHYRTAAFVLAVLVVCTLLGGWNYVWSRFQLADPFTYRREMLAATLDMIRARPFTGFGLGTWPVVYPAYAVFDPPGVYMNHAHNDWAEWTAEGGLPMLAILLSFACVALRQTFRNPWAIGIAAALLHSLVDFPMQKPALACAVFFLAGVSAGARRDSNAAKTVTSNGKLR